MKSVVVCSLLLAYSATEESTAQCTSPPEITFCTGNSPPPQANVNSGQVYWYDGTGPVVNSVNLNGGVFGVCADLNLSSFNFNSGTLIVAPGANLTLNCGGMLYLNGNSAIYNFGTLTLSCGLAMQNSNNMLMNASPSAILTIHGARLELNSSSSFFVNYGMTTLNTLFIQSNASQESVCLGPGSSINATDITNNRTFSVNAPIGTGCIYYKGNALLNNNLTNAPNVRICKDNSASTSGGGNWGSADVKTSCTSCSSALPIELVYFHARQEDHTAVLDWITASEINNERFEIFRSSDSADWETIHTEQGAGNSNYRIQYEWADHDVHIGETYYYKLRQVDFNGDFTDSEIQSLFIDDISLHLSVAPNPFVESTWLSNPGGGDLSYFLEDVSGNLILPEQNSDANRIEIHFPDVEDGMYLLFVSKGHHLFNFKVIKAAHAGH